MRFIGIEMDSKKLLVVLIIIILTSVADSMTRQQMKNTGKMLKNTCMKKIQVPEEMIGNIEQGQFIEDKKVMCYISCIFEMTNVIKNNKINYEASMKQIDMLYPADLKESAKAAATNCKDIRSKLPERAGPYELKSEYYIVALPPTNMILTAGKRTPDSGQTLNVTGNTAMIMVIQKKYKDICEASFWTVKCIYEFKPEDFVFA